MKIFAFLSILLLALNAYSQEVLKLELINSKWFADNSNENFYKSDTIILTKLMNFYSDDKSDEDFGILYFNKSKDTETLKFMKNGDVQEWELSFDFCQPPGGMGNWTWDYDFNLQIINMIYTDKINSRNKKMTFRIIEKEERKANWTDNENAVNFSADMVILKMTRVN